MQADPGQPAPGDQAATPWAPSWAIVTTCRVDRQSAGERTSRAATAAVPREHRGLEVGHGRRDPRPEPAEDLHGRLLRVRRSGCCVSQSTAPTWQCRETRPVSGRRGAAGLTPPGGARTAREQESSGHEQLATPGARWSRARGHRRRPARDGVLHPPGRPGARAGDDGVGPGGPEHGREFPGFLGGGWVRPRGDADEWHMLCRFADQRALAAWEASPERQWWLRSAQGLAEVTRTERRTGIEGWFDEPVAGEVSTPSAAGAVPRRAGSRRRRSGWSSSRSAC